VIATVDAVRRQGPLSLLFDGVTDEVAHLATASIGVLALFDPAGLRRHGRLVVAALVASVVIDLDHIPLYMGLPHISAEGRPYSHSLITVALLLALSRAWKGRGVVLRGAALGVVLHLLRDAATGPGLPIVSCHGLADLRMPYTWYAAALTVLAAIAMKRRLRLDAEQSATRRSAASQPGSQPGRRRRAQRREC
jgi:inner membrane protein